MKKENNMVILKWVVSTIASMVIVVCVYKFIKLNNLNTSIELRSSYLLLSTIPFAVALIWFPFLAFLELRANTCESIEELNEYKSATTSVEKDLFLLRKEIDHRIERLVLNGNISLTIAISCALIGGATLFIFSIKKENFDIINIASRFGIVFLIETIAFFFLRIYRVIIDEVTYFANERTNILFKSTALRAVMCGKIHNITKETRNQLFQEIICQFIKEERNIKLLKGESYMKLRSAKLEKNSLESISEKLNQIMANLPFKN